MNATPDAPFEEYGCILPSHMHDDAPAVAGFWRRNAHADGFLTEGEPWVVKQEPVNLGTAESPVYVEDEPIYLAYGRVRRAPVKPLPTFVPSEATVEAAARALFESSRSQGLPAWEDLAAHQKNWYARTVLKVLNDCSHNLVADSCAYVAEHADDLGADRQAARRVTETIRGRI